MRRDGAPALRAFVQLRGLPAMGRFAGAQAHLRSFAFGNSHGELAMKAWFCEKTTVRVTLLKRLHGYKGERKTDVTM